MDQTIGESPIIISDQVTVNGTLKQLNFHSDGNLRWVNAGKGKCLALEKEALGVSREGSRIFIRCAVESSGGIMCCATSGTTLRRSFVFQPSSEESQRVWFQKLREYLESLGRPKRLFVLVNPYGGKKSSSKIFLETVKPLLEDAEIQFTLQETEHRLHAKELAFGLDLTKYDGIICVSGDGILVEVVNGLLQRDDWNTAIKVPLGVIPAGTSNGMAKSLLDSVGDPCSAFNAVLTIIRGHKRSLDIATISQGKMRFYSVLMLAWGLVADIDIESEKWRWMGSARMDLYAIRRISPLRTYNGRIHFVPSSEFEDYVDNISEKVASVLDVPFSSSNNRQTGAQENGYVGPNIDLDNMKWRTIQGPFVSVWIHNVPWGSEDAMAAPNAKELSNGNHVKSPYVSYFKVKAFVLEPGTLAEDSTRGGIIDCDGEVLARGNGTYKSHEKSLMSYESLQITIDQGLATLYAPSI